MLVAAFGARWMVSRVHAKPSRTSRVFARLAAWTMIAGLLGAVGWACFGLSGYQSNAPLMRSTLTGFLVGGGGALLCLILSGQSLRSGQRQFENSAMGGG
jgi:hypothetical protein